MSNPTYTRLRYIKAMKASDLSEFINRLPYRIEIKQLAWGGDAWFCWYIPPDDQADVQPNIDLDKDV